MNKLKYILLCMFILTASAFLMKPAEVKADSFDAEQNQKDIFTYVTEEMGFPSAAACGMLANIEAESGFNPKAKGDSGSSYGICQWHNARCTRLKSWCKSHGFDYTTLTGQLHYLEYELGTFYPTIYYYLRGVSDDAYGSYLAGYYWCYHFERPAKYLTASVKRGEKAREIYWPKFGKYKENTNPPVLKNAVIPKYVKAGTHLNLAGTITSDSAITKVSVGFYRLGETFETGGSVSPKSKTYQISGLNKSIHVEDLFPGTYMLRLTAVNGGGSVELARQTVTVLSQTRNYEAGNYIIRTQYPTTLACGVAEDGSLALTSKMKNKAAYFQAARQYGGYYSIRNLQTGTYLTLSPGGTVVLSDWKGKSSQLWQISQAVGSVCCLVSGAHPDRCLTVKETTAEGSALVCERSELNDRQLFKLVVSGDRTPIEEPKIEDEEKLILNIPVRVYNYTYGMPSFSLNISSNGSISCVSSKPEVAKVTKKGTVTITGCGRTVISVTASMGTSAGWMSVVKTVVVRIRPKKQQLAHVESLKPGRIRVTWTQDLLARGYEIHISPSEAFPSASTRKIRITKPAIKCKTLSGFASGKNYYVRVRAYTKIKNKRYGGPWSGVLMTTVK